jgi:hypothetical protein
VEDVFDVVAAVDTAGVPDVEDVAVAPVPRQWAYRAIGGISMGAAAVPISLGSEIHFDLVAGLGGYIDLPYLITTAYRLQLAGFCPLEQLEANLADLNDPDAPGLAGCGPAPAREELEVAQDFNHLAYNENGASFDRGFYIDVFQALTMAVGNFVSEPSGSSPYLPAGITHAWFLQTPEHERCVDPEPVPQEHSYNLEYNPEGTYPVILFCDGDEKREGWPDGVFDPEATHTKPSDIVLAVDLNGNGRRDFHEPLVLNGVERFDDVGADGCASAFEDGNGGCLAQASQAPGDPNGDDFHWLDRPLGGEGNHWWDEGEPFSDAGLDGVENTDDPGEGNGTYDRVTALGVAESLSATARLRAAPLERLERMDFHFDAGIRDPVHAATATRHAVGMLQHRVGGLTHYHGLYDQPGALYPDEDASTIMTQVLFADLSEEAIGRHTYVEYGDPNATDKEIAAGDGGHVGTTEQVLGRVLTYIIWALQRFPEPDVDPSPWDGSALSSIQHFYSEGLGARRRFTIALPPGYDDPERADRRYPVVYLLHGKGQSAADFAPVGILTSALMEDGALPKAIVVFPDGRCCRRHLETDEHYCACLDGEEGMKRCIEPSCTGPEESCVEIQVPKHLIPEECNDGSLFYNLASDRWGAPRDDLEYETSIEELVRHVDANWRTRSPGE